MTTWRRSVVAVALATTLMLAAATQLVAGVFRQHPALGDALMVVGGVKLYAPWQVLVWTGKWIAHDPWLAFVHAALIVICLLAAFALAALVGAIEPTSLVWRLSRPGFERWRTLGQRGLLRDEGLALGAVRRHALAPHDIVRAPRGHALLLGAPVHTDDALLAALAGWRGALVLVEARDLSSRLPRRDVMRFAPGRADAIAINPLLGVRAGAHAWSDALTLARGFLRTEDGMLVASFAALALDTLARAPPHARSLSGMRQALADPGRRLAEFCARWAEAAADLGPATGEFARVARAWRRDGEAALRMLRDLDVRLRLFADGDHALATEAHQLRFADLVAGDGPSSLVIQMPPGRETAAATLVSALLAQLVAACAPAADRDHLGRAKKRELLIVIEANALAALTAEPQSAAPAQWAGKRKRPPLFDGPTCGACERGVRFLIQAPCVSDAGALIGAHDDDLAEDVRDAFAAIAVLGPQTQPSAALAAALAGQVRIWRRWKHQAGRVSRWLLPYWERTDAWVVAPETLQHADASEDLLLMAGLQPIRCRALVTRGAAPAFLNAASLPQAPHDWETPALAPVAASISAAVSASPPEADTALHAPIGGSKLRRALARRAAPTVRPSQHGSGERLL
ncbi:MAG: hypothetical protein ACT4OF_00360 [Caulobacteraceae bacterium]